MVIYHPVLKYCIVNEEVTTSYEASEMKLGHHFYEKEQLVAFISRSL